MNTRKILSNVFALAGLVLVLALAFVAWTPSSVQADGNPLASFPQVAHGLVVDEGICTNLVNLGNSPISVQVFAIDAAGMVVKHETLVVGAGQMQTSEVNYTDVIPGPIPEPSGTPPILSNGEPSTLVRTEVALHHSDVKRLWIASTVCKDSGGQTTIARLAANHNETLVRDTAR